jgi:hypothetical protein
MSAIGNGPDTRGLYHKYDVTELAADGTPVADSKHDDCFLFVLDPEHDTEAWFALMRYADLCIAHGRKATLAYALIDKLTEMRKTHDYRTG